MTVFVVFLLVGVFVLIVSLVALFKLQTGDARVGITLPFGIKIETTGEALGFAAIGFALMVVAAFLVFNSADSSSDVQTVATPWHLLKMRFRRWFRFSVDSLAVESLRTR
jgi:hypothetical protein